MTSPGGSSRGAPSGSEMMPSTSSNSDFDRSDRYSASGLKRNLHGTIYQLQLLMLFAFRGVKRYLNFRLATEMDKAEKFDDVVFGYKEKENENFKWRFLQAKHKQDPDKTKITVQDLIKEKDGDFALQKYFISFCNINVEKDDFEEAPADFTLCTNTDFNFEKSQDKLLAEKWKNLMSDPQEIKDDILFFDCIKAKEIRFKMDEDSLDDITQQLELALLENALNEKEITKRKLKWKLSLNALERIYYEKKIIKYKKEVIPVYKALKGQTLKKTVVQKARTLISLAKEYDNSKDFKNSRKTLTATFKQQQKIIKEEALKFTAKILKTLKTKLEGLESESKEKLKIEQNNLKKDEDKWKKIKREIIRDNKGTVLKKVVLETEKDFLNNTPKTVFEEIQKKIKNDELESAKDALCKILDALILDLQIIQMALKIDEVKEKIKDFIKKFRFIVKYPNVDTLNDLINAEFKKCFQYLDANLMTNTFQKDMLDWFKDKEGIFLNKENIENFIKLISEKLKSLIVVGMNHVHRNKLKSYGIRFQDPIEEVKTLFDLEKKQVLSIMSPSTRLSAIRVNQSLEKYGYYKNHDRVIFVKLETLMHEKTKNNVLDTFENKEGSNLLVIECQNSDPNQKNEKDLSDELLNKLSKKKTDKRIIIIVASSSKTKKKGKGKNFANEFMKGLKKKQIEKKEVENKFKDLDNASKNLILDKEVDFQGKDIILRDILKEEAANKIIDESILADIIEKNKIEIGHTGAFSSLNYYPDYYSTRTLWSFKKELQGLLKEKTSFFVTGIAKEKLIKLLHSDNVCEEEICTWEEKIKRIFWSPLEKTDKENEKKFQEFDDRIWLKWRNNHLSIKTVKGRHLFPLLQKYMDFKEETSEEWNLDEKINIVADNPGMGKSTFLTSFAIKMKKKFEKVWFVRINLNDFAVNRKKLNLKNKKKNTKKQIISFISSIAVPGANTNNSIKFQRHIFNLGLEEEGNVEIVVIFDGFDEISPRFNTDTLNIIETLKGQTFVKQLWITTRNHIKDDLETRFCCNAYALQHFDNEKQKQYLNKFWKWNLKHIKETNLNDYKVLKTYKKIHESLQIICKYELPFQNEMKKISDSQESYGITQSALEDLRGEIQQLNFENYAGEMLTQLSKSIGEDEENTEFIGVPLHLEMLGTVIFERKFQPLKEFGLVILYREFIKLKFNIYYQEKAKVERGNQAADALRAITVGTLTRIHQEEALKLFFEEEELLPLDLKEMDKFRSDLDLENEASKKSPSESEKEEGTLDSEKELNRVGILVKNNGTGLKFIHRSFAEYFISEYLVTNLIKKHVQKLFCEKIIIEDDYGRIKSFFIDQLKIISSETPIQLQGGIDAIFENKNYLRTLNEDKNKELKCWMSKGNGRRRRLSSRR